MENINAVNVFSIDEERLKFRVIVAPNQVAGFNEGIFDVYFPPPTSFANSNQYSHALIKLDTITCEADGTIADPVWTNGAGFLKMASIVVQADIGSSQASTIRLNTPAELAAGGDAQIGGFRQLVPIQVVNVGTTGLGAAVVGPVFTDEGAAWNGMVGTEDGIICANPFGQRVRVQLVYPLTGTRVYLTSSALGVAGNNIGRYTMQFSITMVPNN